MSKLVAWVTQYGVAIVFANVLVEQIGIPIPALPTLLVAGSLVRTGKLSFLALLGAAVVASLAADTVWYWLGKRYGHRVLKTLCRISLSPDSCVRQTEGIFEKWGMASVVAAKFITGFSTVAPPLAGAMGAKLPAFLFYDALGTILWAGSGIILGFVFHRAIDDVIGYLEGLGTGALYLVGTALVLFVLLKWWQRRRFYRALRMARIGVEDLRSLFEKGKSPSSWTCGGPGAPARPAPHPRRDDDGHERARREAARDPARGGDRPLLHVTKRSVGGPGGPHADREGIQEGEAARRRPRRVDRRGLRGRGVRDRVVKGQRAVARISIRPEPETRSSRGEPSRARIGGRRGSART